MTMTVTSFRPRAACGTSLILLTMSLGVLIAQIDTSVVNLAVKEIGTSLDAGVTALQWVVDAYNLVYASLLLTAGTLADLYGRRRIFALGIALFTLGSLVCGLAPDAVVLVTGRAIAGLGAARAGEMELDDSAGQELGGGVFRDGDAGDAKSGAADVAGVQPGGGQCVYGAVEAGADWVGRDAGQRTADGFVDARGGFRAGGGVPDCA